MNERQELIEMTADIVSAYVSANQIDQQDLPVLIETVFAALRGVAGRSDGVAEPELMPAVPVKKSVTPEYIICLEDGKKFKSLKRHLRTRYEMTPEDYRAKWGLPHDYPMVAPNYAKARSDLAKKMGLGTARPAGGRRRPDRNGSDMSD
jgi:predicted transcriptional regulator